MMRNIQWAPPDPRPGPLGTVDRFIGPGATAQELWLQAIGTAGGSALAGVFLYLQRDVLNWTWVQWLVVAVLLFDIVGGIITNATAAAKRWYHRPGRRPLMARMPFVALHAVHLFMVAALFHNMDWAFFGVAYVYLLAAAVIILLTPLHIQRPVSLMLFVGGLLLSLYVLTPAPGMAWFLPLFYLKLLVSHLPKEAPFAPRGV